MRIIFEELYVISDLHMGGKTGFQIFDQGEMLARFIKTLTDKPAERRVALVINGDCVDFLAESPACYLDTDHAIEKLDRIMDDPAFTPAWQALQAFTRTQNRFLAVTLGNHDVELALPDVREHFLNRLSGGDDAARGRIHLALDGTGFLSSVGRAKVLCVHGNEVDDWNVIDHGALRRTVEALNQGNRPEPWSPNAGTKLVIDVMNEIKRKCPLVDLLKPESKAALPVVLVLDPSSLKKVGPLAPVLLRKIWDGLRMKTRFLGAGEPPPETMPHLLGGPRGPDPGLAMDQLLGGGAFGGRGTRAAPSTSVADLLADTEDAMQRGVDPALLAQQGDRFLGWGGAIVDRITGKNNGLDNARDALLDWIGSDKTFDLHAEDATSRALDEKVNGSIDFVVTGHTHLQRAIPRARGGGHYYNSGTWIRMIRLTEAQIRNKEKFKNIWGAFEAGTIEALDTAGLTSRPRTVVCFTADADGRTTGQLASVDDNGTLALVEGSTSAQR